MSSNETVIQLTGAAYARMSTEMQNEKSPEDQIRVCRRRAEADGVVISDANLFIDRAVSGTLPDREALEQLKAAAKARRFTVLYVEDLSRLGRESTHLMMLLKELVYLGVRIVSVNEGLDSSVDSWPVVATILGLQHEQYVRDLGHRVRRGQAGAVIDNLSAGDICFGYSSEPIPGSEKSRRGRDGRPRKRVIIDESTAPWVLRIFVWFVRESKSMQAIARELTQLGAPKDHRATTESWHHSYVKHVLTNEKYIGTWRWGRRRNRRNPTTGKIKQVPALSSERVVSQREALRIVPPELWDAAQARLREIKKKHPGPRGGVGRPGATYVSLYPKNEFSGLLYCGACGARFVTAGTNGTYVGCSGRRMNRCTVHTMAPRALLHTLLLERLRAQFRSSADQVDAVLEAVHRLVREAAASQPAEFAARQKDLDQTEKKIRNLNALVEEGGANLRSTGQRIAELEARQAELAAELEQLKGRHSHASDVPSREWLVEQLEHLQTCTWESPSELAHVLRAFTGGRVEMTEVIPPGKKRGHLEARFQGNVFAVVADQARRGAAEGASCDSACLLQQACREPNFAVDAAIFVKPVSAAEALEAEVKALYDQGLLMKEIAARLGCPRSRVKKALDRWYFRHGLVTPDGRARRFGRPHTRGAVPEQERMAS